MEEKYSPSQVELFNASRAKVSKRADVLSKNSSERGRLTSVDIKGLTNPDDFMGKMAEKEYNLHKLSEYQNFTRSRKDGLIEGDQALAGVFSGKKVEVFKKDNQISGTIDGKPMERAGDFFQTISFWLDVIDSNKRALQELEGSDEDELLHKMNGLSI